VQRRYQLIRRLAAGGMGEVFVGRLGGAGDFEKMVAVKLLQPHLVDSPDLVARFYAEARLSARMQHPNIVEVFDVGEADGRPFLAMQFVDGVSLSTALRRLHHLGKRMPLPLVRLIAVSLCEALSYAHSLTDARGARLQVVHRDVTPSNIMISKTGAVLLTDFGIARVQGGALTEPGVVRGKVAYLAPEQVLHNAPVDGRADQYSAALTLFELLCGSNPLRAGSSDATLSMVIRGGGAAHHQVAT
jgi:serine/threonine protein kinase